MVEGGKDFFENSFRLGGTPITVADYYRKQLLIPALDKIATAATWHLQRNACIEAILEEIHWGNWDYCIRHAETTMGKDIILTKFDEIFPNSDKDERANTIFAFFMMNLSAQAALTTLGSTFFGIDDQKELEFKLCKQYQRDIMMIDVKVMDYIEKNHLDDPETAYQIAEWQEERVNKVTQQMYKLITTMKDQIAHDSFDVIRFRNMSDALEQDRADLVRELARTLS